MKRKLLEITEIDCGDETCLDPQTLTYCRYLDHGANWCNRIDRPAPFDWDKKLYSRCPECLEAERKFGDANGPGDEVGRFLNFSMRGGVK